MRSKAGGKASLVCRKTRKELWEEIKLKRKYRWKW